MARTRRPAHDDRTSRSARLGLPPGSPVYTGPPRDGQVAIDVFDYDRDALREFSAVAIESCTQWKRPDTVTWVNVDGIHRADDVQRICEVFGVHPLAMEDVLNPGTRPKADDYGETLYVAAKMIRLGPATLDRPVQIVVEQVSLVLGQGFVLTFQEEAAGDVFEPVRRRLKGEQSRLRRMGPDYLLHALLDCIVDETFAVLERVEDHIDEVEQAALEQTSTALPSEIHVLKSELMTVRRHVWPMREVAHTLLRGESTLIRKTTAPFFRDLYDHVVQLLEVVENGRDRLRGVLDLHLAVMSHRMNEVMRLLTIVTTIFVPLTFIAGVYGMNFKHMPETELVWGYPAALLFMFTLAAGMAAAFRRRGWV